ncbi:balbiani ring protein 3 [Halyomorpha halys]|uniref:balbiani ring protein 3 n=1 Tax=Halyomorpha halys TaxID=286706 RepID=UPI0034D2EF3E
MAFALPFCLSSSVMVAAACWAWIRVVLALMLEAYILNVQVVRAKSSIVDTVMMTRSSIKFINILSDEKASIVTGWAILTVVSGRTVCGPPRLIKFERESNCNDCRPNITVCGCPQADYCGRREKIDCTLDSRQRKCCISNTEYSTSRYNTCDRSETRNCVPTYSEVCSERNPCGRCSHGSDCRGKSDISLPPCSKICQPKSFDCRKERPCSQIKIYCNDQERPICKPSYSEICQSKYQDSFDQCNNYCGNENSVDCISVCSKTSQPMCQQGYNQTENTTNCCGNQEVGCISSCSESDQPKYQKFCKPNKNCCGDQEKNSIPTCSEICQPKCQECQESNIARERCYENDNYCGRSKKITYIKPCAEICQTRSQGDCIGSSKLESYSRADCNCGSQEKIKRRQSCSEVCQPKFQQSRDCRLKQCGKKHNANCVTCCEISSSKCPTEKPISVSCCQIDNSCGRQCHASCLPSCPDICQLCSESKISNRCGQSDDCCGTYKKSCPDICQVCSESKTSNRYGQSDDCCGKEKKKCVPVCEETCEIKCQECPKNTICKIKSQCNDCCAAKNEKMKCLPSYSEISQAKYRDSCCPCDKCDNCIPACSETRSRACQDKCKKNTPDCSACGNCAKIKYYRDKCDNCIPPCIETRPCAYQNKFKKNTPDCSTGSENSAKIQDYCETRSCTCEFKGKKNTLDCCTAFENSTKIKAYHDKCDNCIPPCIETRPCACQNKFKKNTPDCSTGSGNSAKIQDYCGKKEKLDCLAAETTKYLQKTKKESLEDSSFGKKVECLPLPSETCEVKCLECHSDKFCEDNTRDEKMTGLSNVSLPLSEGSSCSSYNCIRDTPISAAFPPKCIYLFFLRKK